MANLHKRFSELSKDITILDAEVVLKCGNVLGESCFYHDEQLKWLDIEGKKIWTMNIADTSKVSSYDLPEVAGCFTAIEGSKTEYLVGFAKSFAIFDVKKGSVVKRLGAPIADNQPGRLNDGRCDRQGRFVVGGCVLPPEEGTHRVYTVDADGWTADPTIDVKLSNSICWSADGKTMFFADTLAGNWGKIWKVEYDVATGKLGAMAEFVDYEAVRRDVLGRRSEEPCPTSLFPPCPDGSTTDTAGGLWNAAFGSGCVLRFGPDGRATHLVRVPGATNVTCCCFGGPTMDTLYVTSATAFVPEGRQEVHGGALFAVKGLGFTGIPETPFFAGGTSNSSGGPPPCRFGIMSTAEITGKTLPGMEAVVAVASRDLAKAQAFIDKHAATPKAAMGGAKACSYDELVALDAVDAVYCPLPTGLRNAWIRKAIEAGKHVYAEKPMGGSVEELKTLLQQCEAANLQFMDGCMWYHSARTKAIEALLRSGELGPLRTVNAAFTFHYPDEAWLDGGNGRTDKKREPMGCLGDQGWYPISAILFAFQWELPERVEATSYTLNKVDTIVACSAVLFFKGGRVATFDCGVTSAHRSQFEIVCEKGTVRVDDLVGGQGRSGDFGAYFAPYVGSGSYVVGDVMGKDEVVDVEACDHVDALVKEFTACVNAVKAGGSMNPEWPRRSLAVHATMSAVFESVNKKGAHIKVRGIEI